MSCERCKKLEAVLRELARPPYADSDLYSLIVWMNARAQHTLNSRTEDIETDDDIYNAAKRD